MTTPNTELQKAVEEAERISFFGQLSAVSVDTLLSAAKQLQQMQVKLVIAETTADELRPLIDKLQQAEKERDELLRDALNKTVELEQAKADRNKAAMQERSKYIPKLTQLRADFDRAIEALKRSHDALLASLNNQGGISGTERFPKPVWREIKAAREQNNAALSTPSAMEFLQGKVQQEAAK